MSKAHLPAIFEQLKLSVYINITNDVHVAKAMQLFKIAHPRDVSTNQRQHGKHANYLAFYHIIGTKQRQQKEKDNSNG